MSEQPAGRIQLIGDPALRPVGLERALARAGHRLADAPEGTHDQGQPAPPPDLALIVWSEADWALAELLQQLAGRPGWRGVPRLVFLADTTPTAVTAALRAGADDAVGPGVPLDEIVARVANALRRRLVPLPPPPQAETLPGLLTSDQFTTRLDEEVARATRYSLSLVLLHAEVAGVETRGAQLGEAWMERLVAATAEVLRSVLRAPDFAARAGRAGFLITLPETDRAGAGALIGRWRRALDLRLGGEGVTINAGQSTLPQPVAPDAGELIAAADRDLERARRGAR